MYPNNEVFARSLNVNELERVLYLDPSNICAQRALNAALIDAKDQCVELEEKITEVEHERDEAKRECDNLESKLDDTQGELDQLKITARELGPRRVLIEELPLDYQPARPATTDRLKAQQDAERAARNAAGLLAWHRPRKAKEALRREAERGRPVDAEIKRLGAEAAALREVVVNAARNHPTMTGERTALWHLARAVLERFPAKTPNAGV